MSCKFEQNTIFSSPLESQCMKILFQAIISVTQEQVKRNTYKKRDLHRKDNENQDEFKYGKTNTMTSNNTNFIPAHSQNMPQELQSLHYKERKENKNTNGKSQSLKQKKESGVGKQKNINHLEKELKKNSVSFDHDKENVSFNLLRGNSSRNEALCIKNTEHLRNKENGTSNKREFSPNRPIECEDSDNDENNDCDRMLKISTIQLTKNLPIDKIRFLIRSKCGQIILEQNEGGFQWAGEGGNEVSAKLLSFTYKQLKKIFSSEGEHEPKDEDTPIRSINSIDKDKKDTCSPTGVKFNDFVDKKIFMGTRSKLFEEKNKLSDLSQENGGIHNKIMKLSDEKVLGADKSIKDVVSVTQKIGPPELNTAINQMQGMDNVLKHNLTIQSVHCVLNSLIEKDTTDWNIPFKHVFPYKRDEINGETWSEPITKGNGYKSYKKRLKKHYFMDTGRLCRSEPNWDVETMDRLYKEGIWNNIPQTAPGEGQKNDEGVELIPGMGLPSSKPPSLFKENHNLDLVEKSPLNESSRNKRTSSKQKNHNSIGYTEIKEIMENIRNKSKSEQFHPPFRRQILSKEKKGGPKFYRYERLEDISMNSKENIPVQNMNDCDSKENTMVKESSSMKDVERSGIKTIRFPVVNENEKLSKTNGDKSLDATNEKDT